MAITEEQVAHLKNARRLAAEAHEEFDAARTAIPLTRSMDIDSALSAAGELLEAVVRETEIPLSR